MLVGGESVAGYRCHIITGNGADASVMLDGPREEILVLHFGGLADVIYETVSGFCPVMGSCISGVRVSISGERSNDNCWNYALCVVS